MLEFFLKRALGVWCEYTALHDLEFIKTICAKNEARHTVRAPGSGYGQYKTHCSSTSDLLDKRNSTLCRVPAALILMDARVIAGHVGRVQTARKLLWIHGLTTPNMCYV